jgi:predicted transcriptional regulator of viral defense system
MKPIGEIKRLFDDRGGMLRTWELAAHRVFYKDIQRLIDDGVIEKIRYGYYQWVDENNQSEARIIRRLFPDGILCMDTALFYHRYSNRTPLAWHIAVSKDSGKSRFRIDYPFVRPYFIEPAVLGMGISEGDIDGNMVRIYDKERTICDCLRYQKKMDREIFNKAIQSYVADTTKNILRLIEYAKALRVSEKVKNFIGVWL